MRPRRPAARGPADNPPSGKPLARANTGLYYGEEGAEGQQAAGGKAGNGHLDPRGSRGKQSPRFMQPLAPGQHHHDGPDTEALLSEDNAAGLPPQRLRQVNEVSESEAWAVVGRGERPAHIYAGPADRSNQAAAGYLRNQSFSFPTMLAAGASPSQAQMLQAAPRVSGTGRRPMFGAGDACRPLCSSFADARCQPPGCAAQAGCAGAGPCRRAMPACPCRAAADSRPLPSVAPPRPGLPCSSWCRR